MRIFIVLIIASVCSACQPKHTSVTDFPYEYQHSGIEWGPVYQLIYHREQIDTISSSIWSRVDTLFEQLKNQPSYDIKAIILEQETRAQFRLGSGSLGANLRYQEIANYLHFWFPVSPAEDYYFRIDSEQDALARLFFFYWKTPTGNEKKQVHFRVQEDLAFHPGEMLQRHLIYDDFLKSGDTLQIISGWINYQIK